eukprot:IDg18079t1
MSAQYTELMLKNEARFFELMTNGFRGADITLKYGVDVEAEGAFDPQTKTYDRAYNLYGVDVDGNDATAPPEKHEAQPPPSAHAGKGSAPSRPHYAHQAASTSHKGALATHAPDSHAAGQGAFSRANLVGASHMQDPYPPRAHPHVHAGATSEGSRFAPRSSPAAHPAAAPAPNEAAHMHYTHAVAVGMPLSRAPKMEQTERYMTQHHPSRAGQFAAAPPSNVSRIQQRAAHDPALHAAYAGQHGNIGTSGAPVHGQPSTITHMGQGGRLQTAYLPDGHATNFQHQDADPRSKYMQRTPPFRSAGGVQVDYASPHYARMGMQMAAHPDSNGSHMYAAAVTAPNVHIQQPLPHRPPDVAWNGDRTLIGNPSQALRLPSPADIVVSPH